ncbi:MAG: fluoride efflux transporter CrcB [Rhodospirillum sp.]|nr:fluoride efflux transporter CrcB [Rhodospirillum sp.]MCF8488067.1 fluoride efflux transporter CrcB [Rhodospirillum sp.]MCF8502202.1 fluoride efflux transporter CrcB [Rhodospirillum sp.]
MSGRMLLAVALGGALGSVGRYVTVVMVTRLFGHGFPAGTVVVNILGSFAMGLLVEGLALRWQVGPEVRALITVGVLGGFTTFSTFSLDIVALFQRGTPGMAGLYLALSVAGGVMALVAGMSFGRMVFS